MKFFSLRALIPVLLLGIVLTAFAYQIPGDNKLSSGASGPTTDEPISIQLPEKLFIRVNLTARSVKKITCKIDNPAKLVSLDTNRILARFSKSVKTEIASAKNGLRIDGKLFAGSQFEIVPEKSPSIEIAGTLYRGIIRLFRLNNSRFVVVNVLPLEDYLASVINGEMPARFPVEARKAQIVAARSYALYQMSNASKMSRYDLFASSISQKYLGFRYKSKDDRLLAGETETSRELVAQTVDLICTMNGRMFCPYYSAVCGGETVAGKHVFKDGKPLQSVKCSWCKAAKRYRWQSVLSQREFSSAMAKSFPKLKNRFSRISSVSIVSHSLDPDRQTIEIKNGRHTKRISPIQFRRMFPAKVFSMRFAISNINQGIRVSGRGHGHGVGMCQWGARGMAMAGAGYQQILKHYYPGCEIVSHERGFQEN